MAFDATLLVTVPFAAGRSRAVWVSCLRQLHCLDQRAEATPQALGLPRVGTSIFIFWQSSAGKVILSVVGARLPLFPCAEVEGGEEHKFTVRLHVLMHVLDPVIKDLVCLSLAGADLLHALILRRSCSLEIWQPRCRWT